MGTLKETPSRQVGRRQIRVREGPSDMTVAEKQDRGMLRVDEQECKGCGLCMEACPPKAIQMSERLNRYGYRTAMYVGKGCTGCGICFLACPEPGAITVLRRIPKGTAPRQEEACASN